MPARCPRTRRLIRLAVKLAIVASPFLAWAVLLLVVPTGWAKTRLSARLAEATGRPVRIGSLSLGMLGNLRVRDIAIAAPGTPDDPWVEVPEARLDVHLGQMLLGRCTPGEVRLLGATIRLLRRPDGTWECGESARTVARSPQSSGHVAKPTATPTTLVIEGATIQVDDRSGGVGFALTDVSGRGTTRPGLANIEEFRGDCDGGAIQLAMRVDFDGDLGRFEVEGRAEGVTVSGGLDGLAHLVPIVSGSAGGVRGKLDLHLSAKGRGRTMDEALRSLRGNGSFAIDPVDLDGSRFLAELDVLGDWPSAQRVGALSCNFTLANERAVTEDLTLQVDRFPLILAGWTDFDGRFDYAVRSDQMTARLPRDARGWLKEAGVNFDQLAGLHVRGTPERVVATLNGRPIRVDDAIGAAPGLANGRDDDRVRLRETARKIRDRFFR